LQLNNTPVPLALRNEVLAVSGSADDLSRLRATFDGSRWKLRTARTVDEAAASLTGNPTLVVLCACQLPDGGWKTVLRLADALAHPANLIVFTRHADDRLWAEVLNLGGFDVLNLPADPAEVFRAVGSAWRHAWDRSRGGCVPEAVPEAFAVE
jgi:DNA-binding NtrC family response regulator